MILSARVAGVTAPVIQALGDVLRTQRVTLTGPDRLEWFRDHIGSSSFTRQDYLRANKQISPATASRDLRLAVEKGLLHMQGDKRTAAYRFTPLR